MFLWSLGTDACKAHESDGLQHVHGLAQERAGLLKRQWHKAVTKDPKATQQTPVGSKRDYALNGRTPRHDRT